MARPKAGTKAGEIATKKWRATMIKIYGSEEAFTESRKKMGAKGGSVKTPTGGFAANRALARIAGARGGRISRRTAKVYDDAWTKHYAEIRRLYKNGKSVAEISRKIGIPYSALRPRIRREVEDGDF